MESNGIGQPKLSEQESVIRSEVKKLQRFLESQSIDPLVNRDEILRAIDLCSETVYRMDKDLSALATRVQQLSFRRNEIFSLLHHVRTLYNKRYTGSYLIARKIAKRFTRKRAIKDYLRIKFDGKCVKCGSTHALTADHIIPVKLGGSNDLENLQLMCRKCNGEKGAKIEGDNKARSLHPENREGENVTHE